MKNKRFLTTVLFTGLFLTFLFVSHSQALAWPWSKGSIKGTVVDSDNVTKALEGVKVTIEEKEQSTVSDQSGEFRFRDLSSGTYTLSFKKPGFASATHKVQVKAGKVEDLRKVELRVITDGGPFSAREWSKKTSASLHELFNELGLKRRKILLAFYKKSGPEECELPDLVIRFTTEFNKDLAKSGNTIVTRDTKQVSYFIKELKEQHQFRVDFDPATVARIGKKLGADTVIIGALLENKDYYEPLVNGTSLERQAYIPGLSINDILLKRGEARCD
jgi:hypothetical protein